jgi:hypothetical protein
MSDQPIRIVVTIDEDESGFRTANPRVSGCTHQEAAEALRAAAELLDPSNPDPDSEEPDAQPTWYDAAVDAIADGDWRRNYGSAITAALLTIAVENRTANMINYLRLLSVVVGQRPAESDIARIKDRLMNRVPRTRL